MQAITAGHLGSNGGIRGHSAGDFFPYRVMVQGTLDSLRYWVVSPKGHKLHHWGTASEACKAARLLHNVLLT